MDKPDKKPVRLSILNQSISLLVSGDPAEMEAAAQEVEQLMTTIARAGNLDSVRVAMLACLHLQDRVRVLERELSALKTTVDTRTKTISEALDQLLASVEPE